MILVHAEAAKNTRTAAEKLPDSIKNAGKSFLSPANHWNSQNTVFRKNSSAIFRDMQSCFYFQQIILILPDLSHFAPQNDRMH